MAKHGTYAGYMRHRRLGLPMCPACRRAEVARREGLKTPPPTRTVLPTRWMGDAKCAGLYDFPDWPLDRQKPLCDQCPVRADCLEYALAQPEIVKDSTTFAGLTGREQIEERRRRKVEARGKVTVDEHGFEVATTVVAHSAPRRLEVTASLPHVEARRRALVEDVQDLLDARETPAAICARLGRTPMALGKALDRAGWSKLSDLFEAEAKRATVVCDTDARKVVAG